MISRLLNTLIVSLIFLLNFIVFLFSSLLISLFALFGRQAPVEDAGETFTIPENMLPGGEAPLAPDAPSLIAGSIFWLVVLGIAIVAFVFFLRERGYRWPSWRQLWAKTRLWLSQWWFGLAAQVAKLQQQTAPTAEKQDKRPLRLPWRFLRLNALSAREQIYYFYLSTVRRAHEKGISRRQSDTPLEYANLLRENLPETTADVTDLTQAFLKAKYSSEPIEAEEATAVKSIWKRLRTAIKQKRAR